MQNGGLDLETDENHWRKWHLSCSQDNVLVAAVTIQLQTNPDDMEELGKFTIFNFLRGHCVRKRIIIVLLFWVMCYF